MTTLTEEIASRRIFAIRVGKTTLTAKSLLFGRAMQLDAYRYRLGA
jgi:peptide subunit release factor RF-3